MASAQLVTQTPSSIIIIILVAFVVLSIIEVFALYLHLTRFAAIEIVLLVAVPLFVYLTTLLTMTNVLQADSSSAAGTVMNVSKLFDVPLFCIDNATLGVNLVGFSIPVFISVKMLLQKRIPLKQTALVIAIISVVTFLYTRFEPGKGMVIYLFAIPPILAAATTFMLREMKGKSHFNPALLSYAGATLGVLVGADILNLYRALTHQWSKPVFISLGGGSVLDAIFLAGIIALLADLIFRAQEENVFGDLAKLFTGHRHR